VRNWSEWQKKASKGHSLSIEHRARVRNPASERHSPTVKQRARDGQDSERNPSSKGHSLSVECRHILSSAEQGTGQNGKRKPAMGIHYLSSAERGTETQPARGPRAHTHERVSVSAMHTMHMHPSLPPNPNTSKSGPNTSPSPTCCTQ
jgi:hypothetical protein